MWLSRAETYSTEYFVIIRFKYLTLVSAFLRELNKNIFEAWSVNNTLIYSIFTIYSALLLKY